MTFSRSKGSTIAIKTTQLYLESMFCRLHPYITSLYQNHLNNLRWLDNVFMRPISQRSIDHEETTAYLVAPSICENKIWSSFVVYWIPKNRVSYKIGAVFPSLTFSFGQFHIFAVDYFFPDFSSQSCIILSYKERHGVAF